MKQFKHYKRLEIFNVKKWSAHLYNKLNTFYDNIISLKS